MVKSATTVESIAGAPKFSQRMTEATVFAIAGSP
jgi:hypothetical protein